MIRSSIASLISTIQPLDHEEEGHIAFAKQWIESGAELFRIAKPATPDPHLVVYFLLMDPEQGKVLLVKHKIANLWLPSGGHVEPGELPIYAVKRELEEELGAQADFLYEMPLFLTVTQTAGEEKPHTDVTLWYILKGCHATPYSYDASEFHSIQWFSLAEIPFDTSDPHMRRMIQKLKCFTEAKHA